MSIELLRIFNNGAFNEMKEDIIGCIYEYFLNKFAPVVASDNGMFFMSKSLVRMIINVIEPTHGKKWRSWRDLYPWETA